MDPQLFCLRWNNHQTNLLSVFDQLLQVEAFCDVTLAVDGASLKCHKMVLAACSTYFQSLFMDNTCSHPIVFLKDIRFHQIRALLDYMYHGEVSVEEAELPALLKIAEALKVKGLVESDEDKAVPTSTSPSKSSRPRHASSTGGGGGGGVGGGGLNPNWPGTSPNAKYSPSKGPREPTDEDPGHLVIDEESNEGFANSHLEVDYDMPNYLSDDTPPAPGMVKTIGPNGKVEWKRYKQYTKDDILAAIEEVKKGMSALQASRKYGVPSRTLYDKVKKMGILTANMKKQQKVAEVKADGGGSNLLPPINLLGLQLPQQSLPGHGQGDVKNPPFNSAMMLSMLERMKALGGGGLKNLVSAPLNLSSMLDGASAGSEDSQRSSGGSSSEEVDLKQEQEQGGDIRAQFFAQLKGLNEVKVEEGGWRSGLEEEKEGGTIIKTTSVIRPLNGGGEQEAKSVTLAQRTDTEITQENSPGSSLPPRKRKISEDQDGPDCKRVEETIPLEASSA